MRQTSPSDINREPFEPMRALLEPARNTTKPRTLDLDDVCCAVPYLLKTGCQWRLFLPSEKAVVADASILSINGTHVFN